MSGPSPYSRRVDITIPAECQEMIARDALVAISTSGGKDSQAMTILISRIVPRDQLVAVHAPLAEVEWPGTIEHIERTLPDCVPLILAPVTSGKSLLDTGAVRPVDAARMPRRHVPEASGRIRSTLPAILTGRRRHAAGPAPNGMLPRRLSTAASAVLSVRVFRPRIIGEKVARDTDRHPDSGVPHRILRQMRIARGRFDLRVTEQPADHRKGFPERQRPGRVGMAHVVY